jgi:hypothetical protein
MIDADAAYELTAMLVGYLSAGVGTAYLVGNIAHYFKTKHDLKDSTTRMSIDEIKEKKTFYENCLPFENYGGILAYKQYLQKNDPQQGSLTLDSMKLGGLSITGLEGALEVKE